MKVHVLVRERDVGYDGETETDLLATFSSLDAVAEFTAAYRKRAGIKPDWVVETLAVDDADDQKKLLAEAEVWRAQTKQLAKTLPASTAVFVTPTDLARLMSHHANLENGLPLTMAVIVNLKDPLE